MASQPPPNPDPIPDPEPSPDPPLQGPRQPSPLEKLLERLPPRYRQKRWLIGAPAGALALLLMLVQCGLLSVGGSPEPAEPAPVAAEVPTPEPTPIPREEYQLPKQYAFVHFVNEMSACYEQNGQPSSLETVEADIMADVPVAVSMLMRLYADNRCTEVDPWHQIPGRAGWLLRSSGMHEHLPDLPEPEEAQ